MLFWNANALLQISFNARGNPVTKQYKSSLFIHNALFGTVYNYNQNVTALEINVQQKIN